MIVKTGRLLGALVTVVIAAVALVVPGCGGGSSTTGAGADASTDGSDLADATSSDGPTILGADSASQKGCSGYPGQSPSSLPGAGCCKYGPSHCVSTSSLPASLDSAFTACSDAGPSSGLCVPDPIIQAGSEYVPALCTTKILTFDLQGVCLSQCISLVSGNSDVGLLKVETCGQGELCVPCIDPLTNQPTGACSLDSIICGDGGSLSTGDGGGGPTCPYTGPPLIDPTSFPACSPACSGAHCVPASLVPTADQSQLASCTSNGTPGFCAPDTFIQSDGQAVSPTCTSVAGAEGRCLSTCLPEIAAEADVLPQSTCAAGQLCAPCYNPVAADPTAPTGACSLACDKPAKPPTILTCPYTGAPIIDPSVFPACSPACAGAHCVPSSLVPMADQSQLAACPGGFCAPDSITQTAGEGVPPTCTSVAGAEGRCLSTCLPEIASEASILPQSTCAAGELCAPCYNPVAENPRAPTGACNLGCDKPAQPPTILNCPWTGPPVLDPTTLPACDGSGCSGAHCLPAAEVPTAVQSQLASCNGGAGFCTPDTIISTGDNFIPTSCDPFPGSGAPGRCLSDCLPAVIKEESTLVQSTCGAGQYCVPCNDPFTGASTGACTLGCDTPPPTPFTFPKCCNDGAGTLTGTCVPTAQVPSSEQSEVNQSGNGNSSPCPSSGASYLCVPDEYLPAPYNSIALQGCPATFLNLCGVCVSECIVNSELGILGSSDCAADHKCVPCDLASSTPGCAQFCP
jgi:hypothetical protein